MSALADVTPPPDGPGGDVAITNYLDQDAPAGESLADDPLGLQSDGGALQTFGLLAGGLAMGSGEVEVSDEVDDPNASVAATVPEPGTSVLLATVCLAAAFLRRRIHA